MLDDDQARESGWVLEVTEGPIGTALTADAAIGATVLQVSDAGEFDEDGGWLELNGALLQYLAADPDGEPNTITLAAGLTVAAVVDDDVWVWDVTNARLTSTVTAWVELQNDELGDDDPVPATVAHGLLDRLPRGLRDGRGEACVVQRATVGGPWDLVDLSASEVSVDAAYLFNPFVVANKTASTDVANGVAVKIADWTFDELTDIDHTAGTFTINTSGVYDLRLAATFVANSVGQRLARFTINGVEMRSAKIPAEGTTTVETAQIYRLVAGDQIEGYVVQNSGAALTMLGGKNTSMTILRLGS